MDKVDHEQYDASSKPYDKIEENIPEEFIAQNAWLYFDDRPVGLNADDLIWKRHDDLVRRQLDDIALQLVRPLQVNDYGSGMTFAILGDWGAGKSSFLKMLREKAKEVAGAQQERIRFCNYVASSYASLDVDVRLTLGIQVLRALESNEIGLLEIYQQLTEEQVIDAQPDIQRSIAFKRGLHEIASKVTGLIEFPAYLAELLRGVDLSDYKPKVLVIMIDDLDRCPLNTVERILKTTQQWAEIDNLFFVLAINREWLLKAIHTLGGLEAESEYALEKYVQHSVSLPILDGERLETYIKSLLENYDDPVSQCIADNFIYIQKGLRFKTPRAVKRLLNSIRPDLQSTLEAQKSNIDIRLIIKELVLRYSWPDFYQNYFLRSVKGARRGFIRAWEQLEIACRAYETEARQDQIDPDDEKLAFSIERIRAQYRDDKFMNPISSALVYFLAEGPYWFVKPSTRIEEDYTASIPAKVSDAEFEFDVGLITKQEDFDAKFMQLYYSGRGQDDPEKELKLYTQAAQLAVENRIRIPHHRADEIGNMALRAEKYRAYDLANALFSFALDLNPAHPNNMQNYISFILDTRRQERYDIIDTLLAELESKYPDFKPERTLRFRAQGAELKGEQIQLTEGQISDVIARIQKNPQDWETYGSAMMIADKVAKNYDLMRKILEITCQIKYINSKNYLYRRVRGFADALSTHREWDSKRVEALEIYRRFLADLRLITEKDDESDIRHNYATLLFSFDYDDEAGRMWHRAYQLAPTDESIRRAYSSYLGQIGRSDLSAKVLEGKPIDEMVLWPKKEILPDRFSDETYIDRLFESMGEWTEES